MDWITFAALVQAGTAIIIAVLTRQLIQVTRHYAETTDAYAGTAERQLKEAILTREGSIRPYVHIPAVRFSINAYTLNHKDCLDIFIMVDMVNAGAGPALSVRGQFLSPKITLDIANDPPTVVQPGDVGRSLLLRAPAEIAVDDLPGLIGDAALKVGYRDLLDHWWITEVPLKIVADPEGPDAPPSILVLDCNERVYSGTFTSPRGGAVMASYARRILILRPTLSG